MMKLELVEGWGKLWRSWSLRFAALGVATPELLQLVADNTDAFGWLNDGYKSGIRLACLVLVILSRPIKQEALAVSAPDERKDPV